MGEIGQVFRLQRERITPDKRSLEIVYGLTTLSQEQCSTQRLFQLIRDHWAVENRLHGYRDVPLGEDRCGVRVPPVAQMLAVLKAMLSIALMWL